MSEILTERDELLWTEQSQGLLDIIILVGEMAFPFYIESV